jgi:hypothetical protein
VGQMVTDNWLQAMMNEIEQKRREEIGLSLRKKYLDIVYREGRRRPRTIASMDIGEIERQFFLPIQLLERANNGIEKILMSLGLNFEKNCNIQGLSGEHTINYLLKNDERQIIVLPSIHQCFLEALGIPPNDSYDVFSPLLALDFFRYIDIINAQEKTDNSHILWL